MNTISKLNYQYIGFAFEPNCEGSDLYVVLYGPQLSSTQLCVKSHHLSHHFLSVKSFYFFNIVVDLNKF